MRFPATAAFSAAALLAGSANADAQSVLSEASSSVSSVASDVSSVATSATSSLPELPTFTPTVIKGDFVEQFTDDWETRWKPSHAKKDTKDSDKDEEWAYVGEWAVEEPHVYKGMEGDKGLTIKNAAAHHAISAKFPRKIDNKGKTLVVQYEVKLQNGLECGGAYLKLLRDNKALHQDEFSNASPYVVMFGPDKCGSTNKVHLIINHKNPKTGEYEEKHLNSPPAARILKTTELYTLIIHPNNTAIIKLNGEQVKEADLLEDFTPAFNPPKEIDDPKDSKPDTWVDEARIADPEAKKPDTWDEEAPFEIVDEDAVKPEDWLEDEPAQIPDPELTKPQDWDDEEDGDWVAPLVSNPRCDEVSGCGEYSKPNPAYFEDKTPANLEPMGAIGFEIWTMQNDIQFNNIYIGHSVADAEKFAQETFFEKHPIEQLIELAEKPKDEPKPAKSPSDLVFLDDPVHYIKEKLDLFFTIAQNDPVQAVKFVPEAAAGLAGVLVTLIAVIIGVVSMGGSTPAPVKKAAEKTKAAATDAKDKVAEAVSTGAEKAGEATKRATRSTS
ncbi:Calnexin-like protein [Lachnellula suecica]|uniref:Calnexin-like protein n=1 Tax=Lachnellula suecica TaxID=602035 RepID=A0A8T9C608_9HELO|nr:Calnexin-like protein [Lachnellula suecica]